MTEDKKPESESEAYALMERHDDEQLLAEIRGQANYAHKLIYSFKVKGTEITGISKAGIDTCCRELAKRGEYVRETDMRTIPDPKDPTNHVVFICIASRVCIIDGKEVVTEQVAGVKRQSNFQYVWVGNQKVRQEDPYWVEKGFSKAGRNARERLLPTGLKESFLATCKEAKDQHSMGGGSSISIPTVQVPPAGIWEPIPDNFLPKEIRGKSLCAAQLARDASVTFQKQDGHTATGRQLLHFWEGGTEAALDKLAKAAFTEFPSEKKQDSKKATKAETKETK